MFFEALPPAGRTQDECLATASGRPCSSVPPRSDSRCEGFPAWAAGDP